MKLLLCALNWIGSVALRRRRATSPSDFGDMGTAFGLDATLTPETFVDSHPVQTRSQIDKPRSLRHAA